MRLRLYWDSVDGEDDDNGAACIDADATVTELRTVVAAVTIVGRVEVVGIAGPPEEGVFRETDKCCCGGAAVGVLTSERWSTFILAVRNKDSNLVDLNLGFNSSISLSNRYPSRRQIR